MSNNNNIVEKAIKSLGKGFDLTCDFRLKYCKGDERLVLLNEKLRKELMVPGFGTYENAPIDIKCDKGDRVRFQSDILDFNQMSEYINRRSSVAGKIPSGIFNSMFGFDSGSWAIDAANTKYLGLDGYFIILFDVHIDRYSLVLDDQVINDVPSTWDPAALARFIEKYGTHIIVGLSIGGQDVVLVRQDKLSNMEPSQLKNHLDELGDQLFTGICNFCPHQCKSREQMHKTIEAFNVFDPQPNIFSNFPSATTKNGVTVMCSKRGGDLRANTHSEWLLTVPSMPDAIGFSFIPITSLLKGVPGKGFLSHAINLYLRYKPPIADLQYFLDFQAHKIWAPIHNDLPLGPTTNRSIRPPALHFNLMGPKLYVNPTQVIVGKTPVTGIRLYLEGVKCDRLAIHLQHLVNTPVLLQDKIDDPLTWHGSEETLDNRYFEAIQRKKFSHVFCQIKRLNSIMTEFFPMKGGEGVYNYTKNSLLQRNFANNAKEMMREAIIENLDVETKTFVIIDMGCSVGPNTFFAMQNIVEAIKHKYHSTSPEIEFHVFFNDHVTNDFNILFKSLFLDEKPYFAAAIPGSFYGRLFPSSSLHIAYSCCALQWLSEAPKELIEKKNKGRIHYDGASIQVWNAYVAQFYKDMGVFLSARAKEIVPGGLILLVLPAIPSEIQYSRIGHRMFTFLESSLIDMVNQGIVEESLVDSFNFPLYFPSAEDMTKVVEKNGCFSIERMELTNPKSNIDAKSFITHIRVGFEEMFIKHFGSKITDEMFERTLEKVEEISTWLKDEYQKTTSQLFLVLKCKINL